MAVTLVNPQSLNLALWKFNFTMVEAKSSPEHQKPRPYGNLIMMKFMSYLKDSLLPQAVHLAKFKVWKTLQEIASVCNSILKSTTQSSAKRYSRTSSKFVEKHEMTKS